MHKLRIRGHAASAGVRLRAKETEISAAPWALEAQERTLLYVTCYHEMHAFCSCCCIIRVMSPLTGVIHFSFFTFICK